MRRGFPLLVGVLATAISTVIGCDSRTDRRVFWRRCGYDYHAFYGYGHVVSLYFAGAGCGVDFLSRGSGASS